mgnify:FL=1
MTYNFEVSPEQDLPRLQELDSEMGDLIAITLEKLREHAVDQLSHEALMDQHMHLAFRIVGYEWELQQMASETANRKRPVLQAMCQLRDWLETVLHEGQAAQGAE